MARRLLSVMANSSGVRAVAMVTIRARMHGVPLVVSLSRPVRPANTWNLIYVHYSYPEL